MKKPKKRGVKPGTKRGPYRKARSRKPKYKDLKIVAVSSDKGPKIGDTVRIKLPDYDVKAYAPNPVLTLCGQLEDSILLLEQRISNAIAKINSLMG